MNTQRSLLLVATFLLLSTSAFSQQTRNLTIKVSLRPAAAPVPPLRFRFHRPIYELTKDSSSVFLKEIVSSYREINGDELDVFRTLVLQGSAQEEQISHLLSKHDKVLDSIHKLALCSISERNEFYDVAPEDFWTKKIPELGIVRDLTYLLQLKIERAGSMEEGVSLCSDGLRLAEYFAEGPGLVHQLTGAAMYNLIFESITKLLAKYPDVNLYWALSSIPRPLVRFDESVSMECYVILNAISELREENLAIQGKDNEYWIKQYKSTIQKILDLTNEAAPPGMAVVNTLHLTQVASAKQFLAEQGFAKENLERMPAAQIIMLNVRASLVNITQEIEKLAYLSPDNRLIVQAEEERILQEFNQDSKDTLSPAGILFSLLSPSVTGIYIRGYDAEIRLNQMITAEAIRLHAAAHGSLPETLAELKVAPAKVNPATNDDFIYRIEDRVNNQQTFTLTASSPINEVHSSLEITLDFAIGD